jgi:hypothetical protein
MLPKVKLNFTSRQLSGQMKSGGELRKWRKR